MIQGERGRNQFSPCQEQSAVPGRGLLCAAPCRGTKPQGGARGAGVVEKVIPLLDLGLVEQSFLPHQLSQFIDQAVKQFERVLDRFLRRHVNPRVL